MVYRLASKPFYWAVEDKLIINGLRLTDSMYRNNARIKGINNGLVDFNKSVINYVK